MIKRKFLSKDQSKQSKGRFYVKVKESTKDEGKDQKTFEENQLYVMNQRLKMYEHGGRDVKISKTKTLMKRR